MLITMVVKLGKKYFTEEIIEAFEQWGKKEDHSTTEAAGDIVAWYNRPTRGYVEMGHKGSKHSTFADSLHRGREFSTILLTVKLESRCKRGAEIEDQYWELQKKKKGIQALLQEIGDFVKNQLIENEH